MNERGDSCKRSMQTTPSLILPADSSDSSLRRERNLSCSKRGYCESPEPCPKNYKLCSWYNFGWDRV